MKDLERIRTSGLEMSFHLDPWDTPIFGRPVARIHGLSVTGLGADRDFLTYEDWARRHAICFAVCRLDHTRLREVAWLQQRQFRYIETMLFPRLEGLQDRSLPPEPNGLRLAYAEEADLPTIQRTADQAFSTSRYALDSEVPPELSGRRYQAWVASAYASDEQLIVKATIDGEIVGFFVVQEQDGGQAYWHLTAVSPAWQGRGVGKQLWLAMLHWHRDRGATSVGTAISAHNLPVIGLYGGLGFRVARSEITLHRGSLRS